MFMKKLNEILNMKKITGKLDGIYLTDLKLKEDVETSKTAWENIYDYDLKRLEKERKDFNESKLQYHINEIFTAKIFSSNDIYLEIGCGPAFIGYFLIKKYNVKFVGIDFNFKLLKTLKQFFDKNKIKNYLLIHADVNLMPIKNNSIDFIYGGGVIEHFKDTEHIINESYRVLKKNGVSFNTVPTFNASWILRMHSSIPDYPGIKSLFEFIHIDFLKNKLLERHHGYELSFTKNKLKKLQVKNGFINISVGSFAFYPSKSKLRNKFLRDLYYNISKKSFATQMYYVSGEKK